MSGVTLRLNISSSSTGHTMSNSIDHVASGITMCGLQTLFVILNQETEAFNLRPETLALKAYDAHLNSSTLSGPLCVQNPHRLTLHPEHKTKTVNSKAAGKAKPEAPTYPRFPRFLERRGKILQRSAGPGSWLLPGIGVQGCKRGWRVYSV